MTTKSDLATKAFWLGAAAAILTGLVILSQQNYVIFHSFVEVFSIAVAFAIFLVAWNVRQRMNNDFLLFVAMAYAAAAILDMVHTLAYSGVNVIPGVTIDPPTQLWIAARYLQALCLLLAPVWLTRRLRPWAAASALAAIVVLVLLTIFRPWPQLPAFPSCHLGAAGLTEFKVVSEYVIAGILLLAILLLWRRRERLDRAVLGYMTAALAVTMASEIAFTSYVAVQAPSNMVGHLLKVIAMYLTYKALLEAGLKRPYDILFRDLADSEKSLRSILDALPVGIFLSDPTGKVMFTNPAVKDIWGMDTHVSRDQYGQYKGRWLGTGEPVQPEQWALARTLDTRQPFVNDPVELEGPSGARKIIHNFAIPLHGEAGQFLGAVVVTEDVTVRVRAAEELRKAKETAESSAAELARSNRELEQFAYIASHDLQEPLRQVMAFGQLLKDRHGDKLEGSAKEYLGFVTEAAGRMSALVRDLLAYSRVGTGENERQSVSLQAALEGAMANLRSSITEAEAGVTHDELPQVVGQRTQLAQLFQNLVGNAIKFRREGVPAAVHVGCRRDGAGWVVSVRDNGIGIAPEQRERVFQIFQRLHVQNKYPGTGIGLAICKKIVEQHGGRIWIESNGGEGTTFCFTLPDAAEAARA